MEKEGCILIGEDDFISKEIVKKMFKERYEIKEAQNGQEAMEIIQKDADKISVIILDVVMPILNGYAVLEKLSENHYWREIPVVVTTSDCSIESDQKLLDLGAYTVIHKPINVGIIQRQIQNIAERLKEHKAFVKDYMMQKTLIHKTANTFTIAYHFADHGISMEEHYKEFFGDEFLQTFHTYPFQLKDFVLPQNMKEAEHFFDIQNKEKLYDEIELRLRIDALHYEWHKVAVMIHCDNKGERDNAVFMFTNIEYEVEAKEQLTFMATQDLLTRVPNMRTFSDDVRNMLMQYLQEEFQMITIDIHQFRLINKLFGYEEGDGVLKYFATKLQELVESYDKGIYCRMASDVFYACFSQEENMDEFFRVLQMGMANYPLKFDFKLFFGIYPIENRYEPVETMIEHASYTRLEVKKNPAQNIGYYTKELREKEYFEALVVSRMEQALQKEEFEVFYQPKCNLHTGKIIGSEALIRWNSPEHGYMSPGIFIPIFEQNGFITELDYYVCENVCKKIREQLDRGIHPVQVSVNISRCDLYDVDLYERIYQIVDKYQIPHDLLEFEITESAFVLENKLLSTFTEELRKHGFRVSIDDFGSGYSSLNVLKNINVDVLKIDIAFLPVSACDLKSPVILAAVVNMAQKLQFDTIVEGVETEEQLNLLGSLGCENVQGYYFYKPMPIGQYEQLLTA